MPTQLILAQSDAKLCGPKAAEHALKATENSRAEYFMPSAVLAMVEP
jgi:hypothetical protein